jgi:hypothetical protein
MRHPSLRPSLLVIALFGALLTAAIPSADTQIKGQKPVGTAPEDLKGGEFVWNPDAAPSGPLVVLVSLSEQYAYVYRNGVLIGYCPVASGKPGHETPTGVFTILQKDKDHVSSIYKAKMPYTQRLTWSGIALHAGSIPGYPNSHGCIHLPLEFSRLLFEIEEMGGTVVIADEHSGPAEASHPGMVLSPAITGDQPAVPVLGDDAYDWRPEMAPEGPVNVLISTSDRKIYVYRNGVEIGFAEIEVRDPEQPVAEGTFTILEGYADHDNPWVPGKPAPLWMTVWTDAPAGITQDAAWTDENSELNRITIPPFFATRVWEILHPGSTIMITNREAAPHTRTDTDFVIMATQHPEQTS